MKCVCVSLDTRKIVKIRIIQSPTLRLVSKRILDLAWTFEIFSSFWNK